MKILIFIFQMQEGGAARVTSTMIKGLVEKKYDVILCTDSVRYKIFYSIPESVQIISYNSSLEKQNKFLFFSKVMWRMRKIMKVFKPDVVMGIESVFYFFTKIASLGLKYPIVAVDHTSMGRDQGWFINWVRSRFYKSADYLSVLTYKDAEILGEKIQKKQVIYNPLPFPIYDMEIQRKKNILCIGRLNVWHTKGFDIILDIWKNLSIRHPDWVLEIAGEGNDASINIINSMIKERNLVGRVVLLGQILDMPSLYQHTSIFALPSRVEGFPMSLIEAMSQGCACISFRLQGAIDEIMVDKKSGYIINDGDYEAFKSAIEDLIINHEQRILISKSSIEAVKHLTLNEFINKWEIIFRKIT